MTTRNGKNAGKGGITAKSGAKDGGRKKAAPRTTKQASQTPNRPPKDPTDVGMNRTGAGTAPLRTARTVSGAQAGGSGPDGFLEGHADVYRAYELEREPIGTMPPPTRIKGAAKMLAERVTGKKGTVLLDKLGERLAFERTGTRLYELLITKLEVQGSFDDGPTRAELVRIRDEEHGHFQLVAEVLTELGSDPTVMTPCADVMAVASGGLQKVIADPRTTLAQALQAIHVAELTDNDGWDMLIDLVEGMGHQDIARRFRAAADREVEHLAKVREWLTAYTLEESGVLATS